MHYNMNIKTLITGTGIHSCLGTNTRQLTEALRTGKCGLHHDPRRKSSGYRSDLCGNVPDVDDHVLYGLSRAQLQCVSQPTRYALSAVQQALLQAEISPVMLRTQRVSLIVSNDSTAEEMMQVGEVMQRRNDTRYLGAGAVFRSLNSTVSMNLASILGIHGLTLTVSAACAGGGHALGLGKMLIETGQADIVIVVGAQETGLASMQSFDALGVFSGTHVAPFGKERNGLAPSGGAACVILENEHAFSERIHDLNAIAQLSGYGFSSNGTAICTPDGRLEAVCMNNAVQNAQLEHTQIDAVLAHATGTPMGDKAEAEAITSCFPIDTYVVATKGHTGHECWMAGGSQAVQAVQMLRYDFLPGVVGTEDCDFDMLNLVCDTFDFSAQHILCNAFGFGGTNSSFIISKPY